MECYSSGFVLFFLGLLWLFEAFCGSVQIQGFFCFISVKNAIVILMGFVLNPFIALGNTAVLIMLILAIHEHGISFHVLFCLKFLSTTCCSY